MECVAGTMILCWHFGIDIDDMDNSLYRVGSDCAICAWGKYYIARIKHRPGVVLSQVGTQPSADQSSSNTRVAQKKHSRPSMWNTQINTKLHMLTGPANSMHTLAVEHTHSNMMLNKD